MIRLTDLLKEIGEASAKPFFTKDEIQDYDNDYGRHGSFETDSGLMVEYEFSDETDGGYTFVFSVEGSTQQGKKTSVSEYLRIMASIYLVLIKFVEDYQPDYVKLTGDDKLGSTGQKNKIYSAYLEKNKSALSKLGYQMEKNGSELLISSDN